MEDFKGSVISGGKPLKDGILTLDNRHYIVPFNNQLKVYYINSRQCIRSIKLDLVGLIDLKQSVKDVNLVYGFKSNGEVIVINWKEKLIQPILQTIQLNDSILQIVDFHDDKLIAVTGKQTSSSLINNKPHTRSIVEFDISTDIIKSNVLHSIKNVLLFNISNDSNNLIFFAKTNQSKTLTSINLQKNVSSTINFQYKSFITSLAISNDSKLAIGTNNGVIHLIDNTSTRLLKWHFDQVLSLHFNNDNYLLSGGLEKVLVFWSLDSEKQHFLPRLNGEIHKISTIDEYIILNLITNEEDSLEVLILSSLDLSSRLLITGPKLSINQVNYKKIIKSIKKGSTTTDKLKYDLTNNIQLHPITKQLYLINGSNLQIFDYNKNEQIYQQKIIDTLNIGKVQKELKLNNPTLTKFSFTIDGDWLATLEQIHHGEIDNLLSKSDITNVLKIWKLNKDSTTPSWELVTKIINPHGLNIPVLSIIAAPVSYHKGLAFLTADNNGGVRLWRLAKDSWSLKKLKPSMGIYSNSISLSWSLDSSLIFLGFDESVIVIDVNTFEEINSPILKTIIGSRVKSLKILNDNSLIILSKNSLKSIDLLKLTENFVISLNSPKNGENLISVNYNKNIIAYVVNYIENTTLKSRVLLFDSKHSNPIFQFDHDDYISSINWNHDNDFIFVDVNSKIGIISNSKISQTKDEVFYDYTKEITYLLNQSDLNKSTIKTDNTDEINGFGKALDINTFASLFESVESIKLETMFEKVLQVVN